MSGPTLTFRYGFDHDDEIDTPLKGYRSDAIVVAPDGQEYTVYFYDPVRLRQDLEEEIKNGRPYVAEPGLIILPQVTRQAMESAVQELWLQGYFAMLRPAQK